MSYKKIPVEFRVRLKLRMAELGIKPKELAAKTKLSIVTINNYLSGKARPLPKSLDKLCEALNINRDYFLKEEVESDTAKPTFQGKTEKVIDISDKLPISAPVPSITEIVARKVTAIFEQHKLSFREVFEVLSILKKNATKQAIEATKDMPYQGGGL